MRLRAYLVLMAAAILVPVIGFHGAALSMLEDSERDSNFLQLKEKVRSVSLLVERERSGAEAALRILSSSTNLKIGYYEGLYSQAKLANLSPDAWFVLLNEEGQQLINTRFPYGKQVPSITDKPSISTLITQGQSVVSDVVYDPGTQKLVTTVASPVELDNGSRYVLVAVFSAEHFLEILRSAEINPEWVAGLMDGQGKFISRTLDSEKAVGQLTRPEMVKSIRTATQGTLLHRTLENVESYTSYRGVPRTNWTVSIAAPKASIDAASHKAAQMAGMGMLAGIFFAALMALFLGGRIVQAMENAKMAAAQLGRGAKPIFKLSHIKEINELYEALTKAGEELIQARDSKLLAETRADEAGVLLQLAVDSADLGTFYCPYPLDKIYWNTTCKRHFFLEDGTEIDFELFYQRIHPDDRQRVRNAVEDAVFNHALYDAEYRTVAPDGRIRWIRAKGRAYYDLDDRPIRFDGITIDISRNKEVEARLEQDSRQKDDFLAMLAHELRNPLAPIATSASLLRMSSPNDVRVQKSSEVITRQVKHMAGLLDDLLDVSRVTKGIIKLDKSVIDIKKVISAASEQVHPLMQSKNHQLLTELPAELIQMVGDEKRLIQVIVNLLTNAARYTPDGGHVRLTLEADKDNLLIDVKDNGIGIPESLKNSIFDLFVQGERTPDRQQGGLGLGLPLVKNLVEHHSGEVYFSSDGLGKGSTFTLRFPRLITNTAVTNAEADIALLNKSERSLTVTVVDDNPDVCQTLTGLLNELGYAATAETDPHEAFERSTIAPTDVYILDIGMPTMDGYELAKRLRGERTTKDAYFIAISGYGQRSDIELSMTAGFNRHLVKPVEIKELLGALQKVQEQRNC